MLWPSARPSVTIDAGMRFGALPALALGAILLGPVTFASSARAAGDAPVIDKATRAKAAKRFKEGVRAFGRHDYAAAADAFEDAYRIAPHPAALFNAADAYEKAGELAKAANLCARYLANAPDNDARRPKANKMLAELVPKLGRVQVDAADASDLQLDAKPILLDVTYVDPGDHVVSADFDGKHVERHVNVVAGSLERVLLEPPAAQKTAEPDTTPPPEDVRHDTSPAAHHGLPKGFFFAGAAATVVLAGVTVWSGLDTNSARSDYNQHPTSQGLDDGIAKEHRTNILLGATAVVGVATAVVGLFATDWKPAEAHDVSLGIGPGSVVVGGRF